MQSKLADQGSIISRIFTHFANEHKSRFIEHHRQLMTAYLTTPKPEEQIQPTLQQPIPHQVQVSNTFGLQNTTVKSEEAKKEGMEVAVKVSEKRDFEMIDTTKQTVKETVQKVEDVEVKENDGMMMDLDLPDIVGDDEEDEQ